MLFKANYEAINWCIDKINRNTELSHLQTNYAINRYYDIINNIILKFTPKTSPRANDFPKWFTPKLIQLIREKEFYYKMKKRFNNETYNALFTKKLKEIKREKENAYTTTRPTSNR